MRTARDVPRLGGRRRVQRRARPAALLRPAHRGGDGVRRQRGGPAARRPVLQGGVDTSLVRWVPYDGVGPRRAQRAELHRARLRRARRRRHSDRGHTAACSSRPATSTGTTCSAAGRPLAAYRRHLRRAVRDQPRTAEASMARGAHGTVVSYDLNYRPSLWKAVGGPERAREVNRRARPARRRDDRQRGGLHGRARLRGPGHRREPLRSDPGDFKRMIERSREYPNFGSSRRRCARCAARPRTTGAPSPGPAAEVRGGDAPPDLEILDRVGGGDSFASGLIYGLLTGRTCSGRRVRRGPRRARDDHAGRHLDGHARGGGGADGWGGRAGRALRS